MQTQSQPESELTEYQKLALGRTKTHDRVGRRTRQILPNRDYIGIIAEGEFAKRYGYIVNVDLLPGGDAGYDFYSTRTANKIDIKATERKNGRLMVKDYENADVYVLAIVDTQTETADFVGWIYGHQILERADLENHYGEDFWCVPQSRLNRVP